MKTTYLNSKATSMHPAMLEKCIGNGLRNTAMSEGVNFASKVHRSKFNQKFVAFAGHKSKATAAFWN